MEGFFDRAAASPARPAVRGRSVGKAKAGLVGEWGRFAGGPRPGPRLGRGQEALARGGQALLAGGGGQAVVAHLGQAVGQNMLEEPFQKLGGGKRTLLIC